MDRLVFDPWHVPIYLLVNAEGEIGQAECGVRETMTESKERCLIDFVIVPVSNVDIITVENSTTFGAVA